MRMILLATVTLVTLTSATLAGPAASTDPAAAPGGPIALSKEQMDQVRAGGSRVGTSSTTRESTFAPGDGSALPPSE